MLLCMCPYVITNVPLCLYAYVLMFIHLCVLMITFACVLILIGIRPYVDVCMFPYAHITGNGKLDQVNLNLT